MENTSDPTKEIVPGEWYFGPTCKVCLGRIVLVHDPNAKLASMGVRLHIKDDGKLKVVCPGCGEMREYSRDELESFQAE